MAISMSRKKSKQKMSETREICLWGTFLFKFLARIPAALLLLILIFLWASATTIISGNVVHVCVSSRKLNNLYCVSAGTQPNFNIHIPVLKNSSGSAEENAIAGDPGNNGSIKEVAEVLSSGSNATIKEIANVDREPLDPTTMDRISNESNSVVANGNELIEKQIQLHRSWTSNTNPAVCNGRGVYVYDLPSKFNKDLLGQCDDMIPWTNFCQFFKNEALGESIPKLGNGWYHTHQYLLEPIFHARILKHPCRVYNENEAKLFYVPYYGGLDILRWHFKNVSDDVKDTLALELLKWLDSRKPWVQSSGKNHVFVLGKISWDFRRKSDSSWGTRFLELEKMQNPMKLLIERKPWDVNDIAIPHPTSFHPHSDDDIVQWQQKIIGATRKSLISFAGAARPSQSQSIRSILIDQCTSKSGDQCRFLNCDAGGCDNPESFTELFMESEFCFQPPGDSPTRKSLFDSLVSGCIPVLFDPFTAYYQYPWHLPEDHTKYSVFIDQEDVRQMKVNVVERLMKVSGKDREEMRRYIVYRLLPGLVYGDLSSQLNRFQDAFSIAVNNLLERVNRL